MMHKTGKVMEDSLENKLKNKTVLVTGASKGVGKAIVEKLSIYNMKIGLLARSEEKLRQLQGLVNASGSEAIILRADLRNRKEIEEAANEFRQKFGTPDFLINNAGIGIRAFWKDISLDDEIDMMSINYIAAVTLIRLFLPDMLYKNRGHIININSVGGMYAAPYQGGYCASKSALLAYSISLAYELEHTNIYISSLLPGPIDTDFLNGPNFDGFKKSREMVSPYDIANKVLSVVYHPREIVFIGSALKLFAVKIANLHPCFFRKIIEKKNKPPKNLIKINKELLI